MNLDSSAYDRWLADHAPLTHNERIALFLLPKDPTDPDWDFKVFRSTEFLRVNGR